MSSEPLPQFADPAQLAAAFEKLKPGASVVWASGPTSLGRFRNATRDLVDRWLGEARATCAQKRDPREAGRWLHILYRVRPPEVRPNRVCGGDSQRVLALLANCARAGQPCPSNEKIADTLELSGPRRARYLVNQLEADGAIRVVEPARFGPRVIEIVSSGIRTAVSGRPPVAEGSGGTHVRPAASMPPAGRVREGS